MDIKVSINTPHINSQKSNIDMDKLHSLVMEFVSKFENEGLFNQDLYEQITSMDINMKVFDKMLKELELFADFDENKDEIDFPYEEWLTRLILIDDNYRK